MPQAYMGEECAHGEVGRDQAPDECAGQKRRLFER